MRKLFYLLTTALLIFASCSEEEVASVNAGKNGAITAIIEQGASNSRMAINENNTLSWTGEDVFSFFTEDGYSSYYYRYSSDEDCFKPESQPLPDGVDVLMVSYPYYVSNNYVASILEVYLPGVLDFTNTTDENQIETPMWGTYENGTVSFKHLAGILRVNLNDLPIDYNQMTIEASSPIAGSFKADFSQYTNIDDIYLKANSNGTNNQVIVKFAKVSSESNNKTLYLPLPVGTYESIQLSVQKVDDNGGTSETKVLADWTNKTVERAYIYTANATYQAVGDIDGANGALSGLTSDNKNMHVVVSDVSSNSTQNTISVPEVDGSTAVIDFLAVEDSDEFTIEQVNSGTTSPGHKQNIFVNVTNEDSQGTPKMTINAPTATVEIGSGTFASITATTATNTLILKSGVSVGNLYLNGGNVIIEENATVTTITNANNFNSTTYIVNKGTISDNSFPTNVVLCSNESEMALRVAVDNGGEVVLKEPVTIEEPLVVTKDLILDLGNYELVAKKTAIILKNGTLTIRNGKICNPETYPTGNGNYYDAVCIEGESDAAIAVNIESTVELNTRDCCVVVPKENESTNITITTAGRLLPYSSCPAIQFNGNSKGCTLNVTGGEITGYQDVAIYFPCAGNLNISGGTITGNTAVYVKSGNLSITGGTLIGNGSKVDYVFNNNGCNATGDALVIDNCNYPSELGTLSISGGTFRSNYAKAIGSYCGNNVTEVKTGFITGGTFSDALAFNYLGADANVTLGADATISDFITISNNATINLGGNNLTGTSKHIIKVAENVALNINRGTISNQFAGESRCIFTQGGKISLTLDAVTLETQGGTRSQPLTIGGDGTGISVSINNSTIEAGDLGYAITTYNPSNVTIENSTITGWCALNVKSANSSQGSAGSIFNIINSTLTGTNSSSNDDYATIEIEDSNIQVDVDAKSALTAAVSENNNNKQYIFRLGNSQSTSAINGSKITCQSKNLTGAIFGLGTANQSGDANYFKSNVVKLPYDVSLDGWKISEAIDGLVSIIGKETSN